MAAVACDDVVCDGVGGWWILGDALSYGSLDFIGVVSGEMVHNVRVPFVIRRFARRPYVLPTLSVTVVAPFWCWCLGPL